LTQWFQRRICFKKFTDGRRTPSDGNNSHSWAKNEISKQIFVCNCNRNNEYYICGHRVIFVVVELPEVIACARATGNHRKWRYPKSPKVIACACVTGTFCTTIIVVATPKGFPRVCACATESCRFPPFFHVFWPEMTLPVGVPSQLEVSFPALFSGVFFSFFIFFLNMGKLNLFIASHK
jgi:hypothetical protein